MKKSILIVILIVSLISCDNFVEKKKCWECYSKITNRDGSNPIQAREEVCDMTSSDIDKFQKEAYSKTPSTSILNIKCTGKN